MTDTVLEVIKELSDKAMIGAIPLQGEEAVDTFVPEVGADMDDWFSDEEGGSASMIVDEAVDPHSPMAIQEPESEAAAISATLTDDDRDGLIAWDDDEPEEIEYSGKPPPVISSAAKSPRPQLVQADEDDDADQDTESSRIDQVGQVKARNVGADDAAEGDDGLPDFTPDADDFGDDFFDDMGEEDDLKEADEQITETDFEASVKPTPFMQQPVSQSSSAPPVVRGREGSNRGSGGGGGRGASAPAFVVEAAEDEPDDEGDLWFDSTPASRTATAAKGRNVVGAKEVDPLDMDWDINAHVNSTPCPFIAQPLRSYVM